MYLSAQPCWSSTLMSPSRGLLKLTLRDYRTSFRFATCRPLSTLTKTATDTSTDTKIYLSRSTSPYLNLSIEHYLLQKTPPSSTILFLYTDRPSVIIGRNQNPWIETNLSLLQNARLRNLETGQEEVGSVDLVRRRSGGGTVFHDLGNVCYSVICPTAQFDRDKHAEMVVRALKNLGVEKACVNERHDIILAGTEGETKSGKPYKISGSAYKLTRLRALHHGTCLLRSPNIRDIGRFLRAPAKPYIKARGVDSVSSPITNVDVDNEAFEKAVVEEFRNMYGHVEPVFVGEESADVAEVKKGLEELQSLDWTYLQTPQFTFSTEATEDDDRPRPELPAHLLRDVRVLGFQQMGCTNFDRLSSLSQLETVSSRI